MIFLSLIYDYVIMQNLSVAEENHSKIDISSVPLTGTRQGKNQVHYGVVASTVICTGCLI